MDKNKTGKGRKEFPGFPDRTTRKKQETVTCDLKEPCGCLREDPSRRMGRARALGRRRWLSENRQGGRRGCVEGPGHRTQAEGAGARCTGIRQVTVTAPVFTPK